LCNNFHGVYLEQGSKLRLAGLLWPLRTSNWPMKKFYVSRPMKEETY